MKEALRLSATAEDTIHQQSPSPTRADSTKQAGERSHSPALPHFFDRVIEGTKPFVKTVGTPAPPKSSLLLFIRDRRMPLEQVLKYRKAEEDRLDSLANETHPDGLGQMADLVIGRRGKKKDAEQLQPHEETMEQVAISVPEIPSEDAPQSQVLQPVLSDTSLLNAVSDAIDRSRAAEVSQRPRKGQPPTNHSIERSKLTVVKDAASVPPQPAPVSTLERLPDRELAQVGAPLAHRSPALQSYARFKIELQKRTGPSESELQRQRVEERKKKRFMAMLTPRTRLHYM
jgi:hypothetical protein